MTKLRIIGGGLAGSEAAWVLAEAGLDVVLHEMRPVRGTFAHQTGGLAELVCSNSFRSDDALNNAVGLLHEEMRRAGSLILRMADRHKLPAGGALAVDREGFSQAVTETLAGHPRVTLAREEITTLPAAAPASPRLQARRIWPFSTPSRLSSITTRSISASPGFSRATTKRVRAAATPITSICRSMKANIALLSPRCWRARRAISRNGKNPRPISRPACPSK
jgi:hypothetical protein